MQGDGVAGIWRSLWHGRRHDRDSEPEGSRAPGGDKPQDVIKEPPLEIVGECLSSDGFVDYVERLEFPDPPPTRVFLHHTWRPSAEHWAGQETIMAMKEAYERQLWQDSKGRWHEGWPAGPHVFVAPDGIWLFTDLRRDGIGVFGHNYRARHVEMVGYYDHELPSGPILDGTIAVLGILHERLGLNIENLRFHRDYSSKTCPGLAVRKPWIMGLTAKWIAEYRLGRVRRMASVRRAVTDQVAELLVNATANTPLARAAEERGLVGALTREIAIELDDEPYLLQFFVEALLVPAGDRDGVQSLREYERTRARDRGDAPPQAPEHGEPPLWDMPPTPMDPGC